MEEFEVLIDFYFILVFNVKVPIARTIHNTFGTSSKIDIYSHDTTSLAPSDHKGALIFSPFDESIFYTILSRIDHLPLSISPSEPPNPPGRENPRMLLILKVDLTLAYFLEN